MSVITEVIVCFYSSRPDEMHKVRIEEINAIIKDHHPFKQVDEFAGGEKIFCSILLIGAFNRFLTRQFIEKLKNLSWESFCFCWVMTQEEQCSWGDKIWIKEDRTWD